MAVVATLLVFVEPKIEAFNIVDDMYLEAPRSPIKPQIEVLQPEVIETPSRWNLDNCSCVAFARANSDVEFERILDPSFLGNNSYPVVGGLIRMTLTGRNGQLFPHVGIVTQIFSNGMLVYIDRMLVNGECIETMRNIMIDDDRVDGFRI